jgi:hypothetical protein
MPEDAFRAFTEMTGRADPAMWLHAEWSAGRITDETLRSLLPHAWTRDDTAVLKVGVDP